MGKLFALVGGVALGLLCFAADAPTPAKKKSTPTKGVAAAHKKTAGATSPAARAASAKRGKKGPVRRTTWRNRQLSPTPERYKEIQEALVSKGYLPADQANGKWSDSSTAALKKFQTDQNLDGSGKINSLSLIALGLGPKRDAASTAKPTAPLSATP